MATTMFPTPPSFYWMLDTLELFSVIFAECGLFLFDQFDDLCDFPPT